MRSVSLSGCVVGRSLPPRRARGVDLGRNRGSQGCRLRRRLGPQSLPLGGRSWTRGIPPCEPRLLPQSQFVSLVSRSDAFSNRAPARGGDSGRHRGLQGCRSRRRLRPQSLSVSWRTQLDARTSVRRASAFSVACPSRTARLNALSQTAPPRRERETANKTETRKALRHTAPAERGA